MRERTIIAFAILASGLLVMALPVSGSHGQLAVGSSHSSESELETGSTTNSWVEGDGSSASVKYAKSFSAGVEDGDLSDWSKGLDGYTAATDRVAKGSYSLKYTGSPSGTATRDFPAGAYENVSFWLNGDAWDGGHSHRPAVAWTSDSGTRMLAVAMGNDGSLEYYDQSGSIVDTGISLNTDTWYRIALDNLNWSAHTVDIVVYDASGNVVGSESGINMTNSVADVGRLEVYPYDPGNMFWIDDVQVNNNELTAASYLSQNQTVTTPNKAWTNLSLSNTTATVEWQAYDGTQWQVVNSAQFDSTGNHTLDISGGGYETWRVNVTFDKTGSNPTAQLHDEGILVSTSAPTADEANATPAHGNGTTGRDVTFEIPVNDTDFGRSQGDSVDATLVLDGTAEGTTTLTSNGTASVTVSGVAGGDNSYHWELTDDYGHTTTTKTFEFQAPMKLSIHKGANFSQLVTKSVEVEIYTTSDSSNFHTMKTVSDGTVVFGNMPDEQLKIELNATNRTARKMIINHPYSKTDRHTVLYDSRDSETFTQCFSLDSQGAGFSPSETWVTMQIHIDGEWRDAAGGYFQAVNKRCLAQQDTDEYRLVIAEQSGDRRSLGGYTADIGFRNEVIPLTVEGVSLSLDRGDTYRWEVATHNATPDGVAGAGNITFKFRAQDANVEDLNIVIYEKGNRSNELDSLDEPGTINTYQASFPLDENQTRTSWVVEWNATSDSGPIGGSDAVQASGGYVNSPLSPLWLKVFVGAFFIIIGGVVGALHAPYGALIAAGSGALLNTVGLYQAPETTVYFALSVAVVGLAASKAGGA
jgi:hypothetical protein